MKIAVMQPYLFPYIGYFHLIHSVDKFIIYDDVNYIKKGWVNRNNIIINNKVRLFTVPLEGASQNKLISQINLSNNYSAWKRKFLKTIEINYKKACNYENAIIVLDEILSFECSSLSEFIANSLRVICCYLDIDTEIVESSSVYDNRHLSGQERILDICRQESSDHYINPIGGVDLYDVDMFKGRGVKVEFILSNSNISYSQLENDFLPWLSIIDVMMFNSKKDTKRMIKLYGFI